MLKDFRTFHIAVAFYHSIAGLRLPAHLKDQLLRASSSVCLNLAEGSGKTTPRDQRRYYDIAMGSLRESQAVLFIGLPASHPAHSQADRLAASLYRLQNPKK